MARYTGAVCRLCRREDAKLYLKGDRCYTEKCSYERRPYPPGQHGQGRRRKQSDYSVQLREKQKVKRLYGLVERQFRGYFRRASRMKGAKGQNLLFLLERRLDNVVFRAGFAADHADARQLVRHGHMAVNGRRVNIPSFVVKAGDVVEVSDASRRLGRINEALASSGRRAVPSYLEVNKETYSAKVGALPLREDIAQDIREQLIVELYSK